MLDLFKSKRFWSAVAGLVAIVSQDVLQLPEEEVQTVIMLIAAWIIGDSLRPVYPADKVFSVRFDGENDA